MPDQSREAMPDIISAKCFGCGHVVKVPAALGGKKARCPKCTETISIPSLADTSEDLVADAMLPEVAREDEELEGKYIDEDEEATAEPPSSRRMPALRRGSSPKNPRARGGRNTGTRGPGGSPRKSSTGLIVGIAVGVLALVVLIAVAMGGNRSASKGKAPGHGSAKTPSPEEPQGNAEDAALQARCLSWVSAVQSGDLERIMKFYTYEPDEERSVRFGIGRMIQEGPKLENASVKSASAASGTTIVAYSGGEKTVSWKQVNGYWMIAGKP